MFCYGNNFPMNNFNPTNERIRTELMKTARYPEISLPFKFLDLRAGDLVAITELRKDWCFCINQTNLTGWFPRLWLEPVYRRPWFCCCYSWKKDQRLVFSWHRVLCEAHVTIKTCRFKLYVCIVCIRCVHCVHQMCAWCVGCVHGSVHMFK